MLTGTGDNVIYKKIHLPKLIILKIKKRENDSME